MNERRGLVQNTQPTTMQNKGAIRLTFLTLTLVCTLYMLYLILYGSKFNKNGVYERTQVIVHENYIIKVLKESEDVQGGRNSAEDADDDSEKFLDFTLRDYPHFPAEFYEQNAKRVPKSINKTCAVFPTLEKIIFNNLYWQTMSTSLGEYQLLGAYWDVRIKNKNSPTIRLLAMITPLRITEDLYCQFWFEDKVVLSQKAYSYFLWHEAWGGNKEGQYKPYLINCKVPYQYRDDPPTAVSLVKNPCDQATNILKIVYEIPEEKGDFAVCVKGLDFHDDISVKLIEWIELLKLLGAEKIYFYVLHVHDEIKKILDYYEEEEGTIETTPVTLPGRYPNEPYLQHLFLSKYTQKKRLYELISYNDCFLKHMYGYKYIALLDIDEVIMPAVGNWTTLMQEITSIPGKAEKSSYNARNVYFFDDFLPEDEYFQEIPSYMHMLQHVYRIKEVMGSGLYIKSFHNTDLVLALHNHYPLYCVEVCKNMEIDPDVAKLQHYRKDCVKDVKNCNKLKEVKVFDSTIWRFKAELIENVNAVIDALNIQAYR